MRQMQMRVGVMPRKGRWGERLRRDRARLCIIITGVFELALTFTDTFARSLSLSLIAIDNDVQTQRDPRRVAPFS